MTSHPGDELPQWPDLTTEELWLLNRGLFGWTEGSYLTDALAVAMGFHSAADLHAQAVRIAMALAQHEPLAGQDWKRMLVATEVAFASDVFGLGVEWETVTGLGDEETLAVLRCVQRKLVGVGSPSAFGARGQRDRDLSSPHLGLE
jgi:hypothetical protein